MKLFPIITLIFAVLMIFSSCKNNDKTNLLQSKTPSTKADVKPVAKEETKYVTPTVKPPDAVGSKRILFVGNSHTEYFISLPDLFDELCKANKQDFKVEKFVEMGAPLDEVYNAQKAYITKKMSEKDPDGNFFDYVVLQEQTPVSIEEAENYQANVKMFVEEINKNSPGTVVLIYQLMDPYDYKTEKSDFDYFYNIIEENAHSVVAGNSNARLLKIGAAVKDAYEGKYGYKAYKGNEDLLRYGENTLHMLNDAGFLSAVLVYETVFNSVPKIPAKMSFSDGINSDWETSLQPIAKAVSNKDALMKIAFENK